MELRHGLDRYRRGFQCVMLLALPALLVSWLVVVGAGYGWVQCVKYTLIGLFYFGLIGWMSGEKRDNVATRILGGRVLSFLGRISYGLYVFHPLCLVLTFRWFDQAFWGAWMMLLFATVVAIVMAWASYEGFERHFLLLKNRFRYGAGNTTERPLWAGQRSAS
jgi:peptidoglycan/LPS O-acetylase OafA/YrhL